MLEKSTERLRDARAFVIRVIALLIAVVSLSAFLAVFPYISAAIGKYDPLAGIWFVPIIGALFIIFTWWLYNRKSQEAERLKYEFITVAAHKFRTPLTRIRWASEALLKRTDIPKDAMDFLQNVKESDLELIQLSNLLMDAARMDKERYAYEQSLISLEPIAEEMLSIHRRTAAEKHIALSFTPQPFLPAVRGDKERLTSAIAVFIENAVSYTPENGSVKVEITSTPEGVRFAVTDTGIGVTESEKRHIFKKFYRTDRARSADTEGVGLGLHMAKNIIERHHGTIGVTSAGEGKGSTFWFTLPIPTNQAVVVPPPIKTPTQESAKIPSK